MRLSQSTTVWQLSESLKDVGPAGPLPGERKVNSAMSFEPAFVGLAAALGAPRVDHAGVCKPPFAALAPPILVGMGFARAIPGVHYTGISIRHLHAQSQVKPQSIALAALCVNIAGESNCCCT